MPIFTRTLGVIAMKLAYILPFICFISCTYDEDKENQSDSIFESNQDTIISNASDYDSSLYWKIHDDSSSYRIVVGTDSANCEGYCTYYFGISTKGIVLSKEKDMNPHKTPTPIVRYIMPEEYDYKEIESLIDFDAYMKMAEPKHSIENLELNTHWYAIIDTSGREVRHFYDPGEEPETIKPLLNYLKKLVENHPKWEELKMASTNHIINQTLCDTSERFTSTLDSIQSNPAKIDLDEPINRSLALTVYHTVFEDKIIHRDCKLFLLDQLINLNRYATNQLWGFVNETIISNEFDMENSIFLEPLSESSAKAPSQKWLDIMNQEMN